MGSRARTPSASRLRGRRWWRSCCTHVTGTPSPLPAVTYYMNRLQGLAARRHYCVTLNRTADIRPDRILRQFIYTHPIFDQAAVEAQSRRREISGPRSTFYAGAYWGYGFHEDGVQSGLQVVDAVRAETEGARRSA